MITEIRSLAYHYDAADMQARARQSRLAREAHAHVRDTRRGRSAGDSTRRLRRTLSRP